MLTTRISKTISGKVLFKPFVHNFPFLLIISWRYCYLNLADTSHMSRTKRRGVAGFSQISYRHHSGELVTLGEFYRDHPGWNGLSPQIRSVNPLGLQIREIPHLDKSNVSISFYKLERNSGKTIKNFLEAPKIRKCSIT